MRALWGVLSLLLVLAVVGLVATKQLKTLGASTTASAPSPPAGVGDPAAQDPAAPSPAASPQQLQERIRSDLAQALDRGAARNDDAAR